MSSDDTLVDVNELTDRQQHLIRTGYQVFSETGIERAALQEIADRAGVSKGLILYHFGSKEAFAAATMEWALTRTAERIRRSLAEAASAEDRITAMLAAIFHDAEANRRFYLTYLDLLSQAGRVERFGVVNEGFRRIVNALYREVAADGAAEGIFEVDDPDEAAEAMRAIIDGTFLLWLQEPDWRRKHTAYRDRCKRILLRYLGCC
ncbi:MAG TPA: TetR family transcriptional regulator [Actinobacteria bacterium]|nr:TetR family transcriptional regulator [Actinomycetota bacterium]